MMTRRLPVRFCEWVVGSRELKIFGVTFSMPVLCGARFDPMDRRQVVCPCHANAARLEKDRNRKRRRGLSSVLEI